MFSKIPITRSTGSYSENIKELKTALDSADAVIIGAGAGLSTSAGFTYSGERFQEHFSDFEEKYGFHDMYSGAFYPFKTAEERWPTGAALYMLTAIWTRRSRCMASFWSW